MSGFFDLWADGDGDQRMPVWIYPIALAGLYATSQGYLMCNPGPDPGWGDKVATFRADKPQQSPLSLDSWGGPQANERLRVSVSRLAETPATLGRVFVVRDKPMAYLKGRRRHERDPLLRPHVDGFPLVFCGHVTIEGRLQRFSYMPQIQELIRLDLTATGPEATQGLFNEPTRERRIEVEYQRMCGRSLERGGTLMSSAR